MQNLDYIVFYDKPLLKFDRLLKTYLSLCASRTLASLCRNIEDFSHVEDQDFCKGCQHLDRAVVRRCVVEASHSQWILCRADDGGARVQGYADRCLRCINSAVQVGTRTS